jgi:hypothetical protein
VMDELKEEQMLVAEIENSDQEFLNELKSTITEQACALLSSFYLFLTYVGEGDSIALDTFRADLAENKTKIEEMEEKLSVLEVEKQDELTRIAELKRQLQIRQGGTHVQVAKLRSMNFLLSYILAKALIL